MTTATKPKTVHGVDALDFCSRCHGTGREPDREPLTDAQREIVVRLADVGAAVRKASNSRTPEGIEARRAANTELRVLADRARNLGLTKRRVAAASGFSLQGLHNILTHVTTV